MILMLLSGLLSCNINNGAAASEPNTSPAKEFAAGKIVKNGLCPSGIGASAGDVPKLETISNGTKLIVCGYSTESEFDVYSVSQDSTVSRPIITYGALDRLKTHTSGDQLILDELTIYKNDLVPTFQRKIVCNAKQCELSIPVCIYKKPSGGIGDLSEIRSYQRGKNKNKHPDEMVIQRASDLALAGNKQAQDIFLESPGGLKLDGAAAEEFRRSVELLKKLKSANCL